MARITPVLLQKFVRNPYEPLEFTEKFAHCLNFVEKKEYEINRNYRNFNRPTTGSCEVDKGL